MYSLKYLQGYNKSLSVTDKSNTITKWTQALILGYFIIFYNVFVISISLNTQLISSSADHILSCSDSRINYEWYKLQTR